MKDKNRIIDDWLEQHGDHEIEKFVAKNMAIIEKVRIKLDALGWSKRQFAEAMGIKPSEVSKWLSGTHNLTMKSIVKMESALGIDLS
ncbi:XRE family transcriptional regulator [Puteibacter caeruleilacunae]|nr:XRE family transcriptional regulator [Puteibacter caeruleilacunae]